MAAASREEWYPLQMAHETELKALTEYLEQNSLKQTKQREVILGAFLESKRHVTSDDLYQKVREEHPNVGYTTVYRTMKLLVDAGLATEHNFDDGITRYEIEHEHHDHLVCLKCGKIVEFESPLIEDTQREIAERHDFKVLRHRHELYGHCADCQNT